MSAKRNRTHAGKMRRALITGKMTRDEFRAKLYGTRVPRPKPKPLLPAFGDSPSMHALLGLIYDPFRKGRT